MLTCFHLAHLPLSHGWCMRQLVARNELYCRGFSHRLCRGILGLSGSTSISLPARVASGFCRYVVQCLCRSGCVWHLYRSQSGGYLSTVVCLPHLWGCRMLPHTLEPESSGCQFRFFCGFLNAVVLGLRLVSIWVRLHLLEFHAHAVAAVPHSGGNIIPHSLSSRL